jgi:hypothetical protein
MAAIEIPRHRVDPFRFFGSVRLSNDFGAELFLISCDIIFERRSAKPPKEKKTLRGATAKTVRTFSKKPESVAIKGL